MFLSRLRFALTESKKIFDSSVVERDALRLSVRAGSGGQGLGRYNGLGGNGGDVYLVPRRNMTFRQLLHGFEKNRNIIAEHGASSTQVSLVGKHGAHTVVNVPLGTECIQQDTLRLICRCTNPNHRVLIAKGGRGGCGENGFKGEKGDKFTMTMHMKLAPNIGLVGFPNAGKSTLLKALAPEKRNIKIAPYPFTTTKPQMIDIRMSELMEDHERFSLSCADLPGLIEGAAQNRGRGHSFLKHLEYSDMIVMVVDITGFQLSSSSTDVFRDGLETIALLNKELEAYDRKLIKKPIVLVLNKTDIDGAAEKAAALSELANGKWFDKLPQELRPSLPIAFHGIVCTSAKNREIGSLKKQLLNIYDGLHPLEELSLDSEFESENTKIIL
uniref:OBG-type G domain-containing protein n=1 Tax=Panagrellus redivivus TaxID=6233 RepID=A0A7E4UVZ1_PANRE